MVAAWQFGLVGILAVALVTDVKSHKIYNWLTFPAMAMGLLLHIALQGLPGLGSSLLGFVAAVAIFVFGFFLPGNQMGAGDVKLMAAIGLWLGWPVTLAALVYITVTGAIVSILVALRHGVLIQTFKNVYWVLAGLVTPGLDPSAPLKKSAGPPFPYGVSIVIGAMLALFFPELQSLFNVLKVG